MKAVPRLAVIILLALALDACTSSSGGAVPPSQPPAPAATSRPTAVGAQASPVSRGLLQLSGGVDGFLSVLSVTCSDGGPNLLVAIRGRIETALYGVEIAAPRTGSYSLGQAASVSVRLSSQKPADANVSRWSAGIDGVSGSGELTLSADGGTVDADLEGIAATRGAVHLRGSWSCAT